MKQPHIKHKLQTSVGNLKAFDNEKKKIHAIRQAVKCSKNVITFKYNNDLPIKFTMLNNNSKT